MKAAPFAYVRPATVADAVAALAETGGDGKVLAGGQSLVPVLAMRLGRPGTLVDVNAIAGLDELATTDVGLRVGAAVRQRRLEHEPAARAVPLLGMALPFVGHRELRSRGTVCGSLAHADPAAELPAVACCLNATLDVTGRRGNRTVPAPEFFTGAMTTVLEPDELLTAVTFPLARAGEGFGFAEVARRHGDFALAGVVTRVRVTDGVVAEAVLAAFGVSDRPVVRDVTDVVRAHGTETGALRDPMNQFAADVVDTAGDAHGSTAYRRRLFAALAARELAAAYRKGSETQ
ncbi:MAG: FAD binding domain-containing protein [Streptosporangiales bacterium]|nr:FAD binding domain-containing protein [Streptosporangiales bacterium]MBO0892055.1 FAD binding domain-containing protein [Acidothermales bacterium]